MGYTITQLHQMSYEELMRVSIQDMAEEPPRRSAGRPYYVCYQCRYCGKTLEGSERRVKELNTAHPVNCPYCHAVLWSPEGKNHLRKTAFMPGHYDSERKKAYLKYLREQAKRKENL